MTTTVEIAGRTYAVSLRPSTDSGRPGVFIVEVNRRDAPDEPADSFEVEARPTATGTSFVYLSEGRHIEAAVTLVGGQTLVQWGATEVTAQVRARTLSGEARETGGHAGETRLVAPMPGRVVRVLAAPGDLVVARQGLVVMEAMKMENELGAPRGGRIREVAVVEGTSVESGRVLVVIE